VTGRSKDQDLIDELAAWMQKPDTQTVRTNGHTAPKSAPMSSPATDEMIIQKCRGAENAAKFVDLFDHGDVHAYHSGDASVADLALLSMLTFWTQDAAQLERIFSSSALGNREKWLERDDYRKRTIRKALADLGEVYDWSRNNGGTAARPLKKGTASAANGSGPADLPYKGESTRSAGDEARPKLSLVRFAEREAPPAREFIVPDLIPRYHPTTLYGLGGTAKSLIAALLSMNVAGGREKFFGRDIAVHGPVMYLDFELDADEQHRRVMQLATGMKMKIPEGFLYVSTLGVRTHEAVEFALSVCEEHKAVMVVLDSLGPAMVGDMAAAKDVIEFHNCYIAPFKAAGVTPLLVDHQARQQAGEGYQSKGAFGSAYKEHLSRSLIQVEAGDRSAELGTLNVRLRHKKTNFGALADPFDVSLSFSDEMIVASTRDLTPADRAQETTLNAEDRVVAALEDGPAYPDEITETTGLARSTVKNKINALKKAGRVETTGEIRGQMEQVQLVDSGTRPMKEKSAKSAPDSSTVAGLFADPPDWLPGQLEKCREDPDRHLGPLCTAVAAEVLGDGLLWEDVREEVERELERREA
jgi:DNA-binding transcriptional ArsR family regulator